MKADIFYDVVLLEDTLSSFENDYQRIDFLIDYIWYNFDVMPDKCKELAEWSRKRSEELNYERGLGYVCLTEGYRLMNLGGSPEVEVLAKKSLEIFLRLDDPVGLSRCYNMIAYGLWYLGDYDQAVETALLALRNAERSKDVLNIGWTNYAMGVFYNDLKDFDQAIGHFTVAIRCAEESGERFIHARALGALGSVYLAQKDLGKAEDIITKASEKYRMLNYASGEARVLNDLAVIARLRGDFTRAEEMLKQALQIRRDKGLQQGEATTLLELAALFLETKQLEKVLTYLEPAIRLCEQLRAKPKLSQGHRLLSDYYKYTSEPWKALEHLEISHSIKSSFSGEQAQNKIKQLQTTFATEKAEKEKEIERLRHVELKHAYDLIEQKNKDILDSINYARRIQLAILPSGEELKKAFSDAFFLYIPREVVSGDFYWYAESDGDHFLAAVDCTGHGVPGAFMSMIGNTLLNEIVMEKKIREPSKILEHLRDGVIKSLRQTGAEGENRDGMDISLVRYRKNPGPASLSYAGANNPLWIMRAGDLLEMPATKQPIGVYHGTPKPFHEKEIELFPGDKFFLFTDGYADQFGGEDFGKKGGKKFKYSRLKELLLEHRNLPMPVLSEKLKTAFEKWKGELEQTDDVLLIGVRVS